MQDRDLAGNSSGQDLDRGDSGDLVNMIGYPVMIDFLSWTDRQDDRINGHHIVALTGGGEVADDHALILTVTHHDVQCILLVILKKDLK